MCVEFSFDSESEFQTQLLGQTLAGFLVPGMTIALNGQLGSGKTQFVREICHGLGASKTQVNSPTFVLMQQYTDGRIPVCHFDVYRLADVDEFLAIGGDEYLDDTDLLCCVEWAERIADILPAERIVVDIDQTAETSRRFRITATGQNSVEIIQQLRDAM